MELTVSDLKPIIESLIREILEEFVRENELRARELRTSARFIITGELKPSPYISFRFVAANFNPPVLP
jgi:hypothetical protein